MSTGRGRRFGRFISEPGGGDRLVHVVSGRAELADINSKNRNGHALIPNQSSNLTSQRGGRQSGIGKRSCSLKKVVRAIAMPGNS
jgi:hypothetical protein